MSERSEQEQLANLVGGEDGLEPIDTGDILANGLASFLGDPTIQVAATANGYVNHERGGEEDVASPIKRLGEKGQIIQDTPQEAPVQRVANSEKLLIALYDIRDNLIETFGSCKFNSSISESLSGEINKLGSCIVHLGGKVDQFDPLNHISGLEVPDAFKNAEEVIERTMQCYKLGKIEEAKIAEDGKEINIVFSGSEGDTNYVAHGRIIAKAWTGNEAIDYVYTPSSGKMSVKAFEGGRWNSKNDPESYKVSWELTEEDKSQNDAKTSLPEKEVSQNSQNNESEQVQQVEKQLAIETDVNGEEDIGSPID